MTVVAAAADNMHGTAVVYAPVTVAWTNGRGNDPACGVDRCCTYYNGRRVRRPDVHGITRIRVVHHRRRLINHNGRLLIDNRWLLIHNSRRLRRHRHRRWRCLGLDGWYGVQKPSSRGLFVARPSLSASVGRDKLLRIVTRKALQTATGGSHVNAVLPLAVNHDLMRNTS